MGGALDTVLGLSWGDLLIPLLGFLSSNKSTLNVNEMMALRDMIILVQTCFNLCIHKISKLFLEDMCCENTANGF